MENPVRSPMVPPIADNMSTNFADLSLMILSNVGVSKKILTTLSLFFHSKSKNVIKMQNVLAVKHQQSSLTFKTCRIWSYNLVFIVSFNFVRNQSV